jgi:hypothetical protein
MLLLPLVQAGHLDAKKGETLKEKTLWSSVQSPCHCKKRKSYNLELISNLLLSDIYFRFVLPKDGMISAFYYLPSLSSDQFPLFFEFHLYLELNHFVATGVLLFKFPGESSFALPKHSMYSKFVHDCYRTVIQGDWWLSAILVVPPWTKRGDWLLGVIPDIPHMNVKPTSAIRQSHD